MNNYVFNPITGDFDVAYTCEGHENGGDGGGSGSITPQQYKILIGFLPDKVVFSTDRLSQLVCSNMSSIDTENDEDGNYLVLAVERQYAIRKIESNGIIIPMDDRVESDDYNIYYSVNPFRKGVVRNLTKIIY